MILSQSNTRINEILTIYVMGIYRSHFIIIIIATIIFNYRYSNCLILGMFSHCILGAIGSNFAWDTSYCLENAGALTSYKPMGLHGLLQG
jgi:hypothetical protein